MICRISNVQQKCFLAKWYIYFHFLNEQFIECERCKFFTILKNRFYHNIYFWSFSRLISSKHTRQET